MDNLIDTRAIDSHTKCNYNSQFTACCSEWVEYKFLHFDGGGSSIHIYQMKFMEIRRTWGENEVLTMQGDTANHDIILLLEYIYVKTLQRLGISIPLFMALWILYILSMWNHHRIIHCKTVCNHRQSTFSSYCILHLHVKVWQFSVHTSRQEV